MNICSHVNVYLLILRGSWLVFAMGGFPFFYYLFLIMFLFYAVQPRCMELMDEKLEEFDAL